MTESRRPGETPRRPLEAVAFDLYGTLISIAAPLMHREVPRLFGVPARQWLELVRGELLTTAFPDTRGLTEFICRSLTGTYGAALAEACAALIERELASAHLVEGALPLLHFLKGRGLKLGLISNVSSAHKEPVRRLGLEALFDATVFSCDVGRTKPDPEIYRELCRRLAVEPEAVLMVGDSLPNDVLAPASLGMLTARIDRRAAGRALMTVADLAWWKLAGPEPAEPMLERGRNLVLGTRRWTVSGLRPVSGDVQGRYNLVYELEVAAENAGGDGPCTAQLLTKRYLFPASAELEAFAYQIQGCAGLSTCEAWTVGDPERFLVVSRAPGRKFAGEPDPAVAHEVGRHLAFAYVFANADMRPRNAFVARGPDGRATMTMVDLEHCFLNLAIDVASLPDPLNPDAIDALGPATLRSLIRKRVLTPKTLPRTRGEFLDVRTAPADVTRACGDGFLDCYRELKARGDAICDLIGRRIRERPYLVIGTRGYRRAMAGIDLDDIRERLAADPGPVLDQVLAARP